MPYLYSEYDSEYDSSEPYLTSGDPIPNDVASGETSMVPRQILLARPASTGDFPPSNKPRPLLIERQGDRYVRFGGIREPQGSGTSPEYEPDALPVLPRQTKAQPAELPPSVIVYRDGHREEIADYAIINGVIYVSGNYWQDCYATKQIPLAGLDLDATVQANQRSGAKFQVPSAPNVVIASF